MPNIERKEAFRAALIEPVNAHKKGITPEDVAAVFAEEGNTAPDHRAWKPHPRRAASEHLVAAASCLNDGRVIPVPRFEVLFPVSNSVI
ncbi:hypothetical protein [Paraburkholderia terrae]|uniref:hypothetical protein n=1 Tax=Paraburkholderia terrae TaxID=311230 RepID=UPI00206D7D07|nr:hypothetical protein [Paraburkholderia terrae]BDC45984.1 hypothetical protein PTKU15_92810 [Paraburkholderia terrae]